MKEVIEKQIEKLMENCKEFEQEWDSLIKESEEKVKKHNEEIQAIRDKQCVISGKYHYAKEMISELSKALEEHKAEAPVEPTIVG